MEMKDGMPQSTGARRNGSGISAGGVWAVSEPAAGRCGGVFHVFRDDVHCDICAVGVESNWASHGELRGYVSVCGFSVGGAGADGGGAVLWSAVDQGEAHTFLKKSRTFSKLRRTSLIEKSGLFPGGKAAILFG
jgi:hypothetical protein